MMREMENSYQNKQTPSLGSVTSAARVLFAVKSIAQEKKTRSFLVL